MPRSHRIPETDGPIQCSVHLKSLSPEHSSNWIHECGSHTTQQYPSFRRTSMTRGALQRKIFPSCGSGILPRLSRLEAAPTEYFTQTPESIGLRTTWIPGQARNDVEVLLQEARVIQNLLSPNLKAQGSFSPVWLPHGRAGKETAGRVLQSWPWPARGSPWHNNKCSRKGMNRTSLCLCSPRSRMLCADRGLCGAGVRFRICSRWSYHRYTCLVESHGSAGPAQRHSS